MKLRLVLKYGKDPQRRITTVPTSNASSPLLKAGDYLSDSGPSYPSAVEQPSHKEKIAFIKSYKQFREKIAKDVDKLAFEAMGYNGNIIIFPYIGGKDYSVVVSKIRHNETIDTFLTQKLEEIKAFAREHHIPNSECKSQLVKITDIVFPVSHTTPKQRIYSASSFWKDRTNNEKPINFILSNYKNEIENGMTQADLRNVDHELYRAFHNYCHYHGISPDTILPRSRQRVSEGLGKFGEITHASELDPSDDDRDRRRLYQALKTRKSRQRRSEQAAPKLPVATIG